MGYMIEFRDEEQFNELKSKAHNAKKAICEFCDALEDAEDDGGAEMGERRGYGGRGSYRDSGYRDRDYRDRGYRYEDERMGMRRDSRGRYM